MALDSRNLIIQMLDLKTVTNGWLIDENGILRWRHLHGFRLQRPEMWEIAERLVSADLGEVIANPGVRQESLEIESVRGELAADPDNPDLLFLLAEILSQAGGTEEAIDTYRRVADLDPRNSSALYAIGSLQASKGRKDEAAATWRQALDRDPLNFTLRKQIWRLEYPDRFYPDIDMKFQVQQILKEGYPDISKLPVSIRTELEKYPEYQPRQQYSEY